ncbi:MAG TPA: FtsX-like permease family protein [Spongiibacteraceae bacterium]
MIGTYLLRLVMKNMWRHQLRTALTVLGITVAIISFGLLRTIVSSWYASAEFSSSARLVTRNAISLTFPLPITYAEKIRQVAGVANVTWANWFGGIYINQHNFFPQFAIHADSYFDIHPEYVLSYEQKKDFMHDRRGCVVGRKIADQYGWKIGDQIPLRGTIYPGIWNFVVRGIYEPGTNKTDASQFLLHWEYLNERVKSVLPSRAESTGLFIVQLADSKQAATVSAAIDSVFHNSLAETRTETQKAFQLGFVAMVDTILIAIQSVAFVVIVIILAVVANTMTMTARERTPEYATLKALGFSVQFVVLLIVGESIMIALTGGALGMLGTFPVAQAFSKATGSMFAVFEVSSSTLWLQLIAAVLVGLLASIIPAWHSARIRIVDGLRAVA